MSYFTECMLMYIHTEDIVDQKALVTLVHVYINTQLFVTLQIPCRSGSINRLLVGSSETIEETISPLSQPRGIAVDPFDEYVTLTLFLL